MNLRRTILAIILCVVACKYEKIETTGSSEIHVPDSISQLENLTVYSPDIQSPDTVLISKETVFESSEDVFMSGYISTFTVDDSNRVYIVSSVPGDLGVYVFNSDGSYLTTIGSFGRGPGEFEAIGAIDIWWNQLTMFDPRLQKFAVYSLGDFEKTGEELINMEEVMATDSLTNVARGNDLFVTERRDMILSLSMTSLTEEFDINRTLYYSLSSAGVVRPGKLLELERYPLYFPPERERFDLPVTMPFTRSSLVAITREGSLFTAWTEEFLVKKYDQDGEYIQAFYYPVENSTLFIDKMEISDYQRKIIRNYEMPETWPVLHTMELDDEGRLWIATITDSESIFTWWVLDQEGELLARFQLPGERASRFARSQPEIVIKNGYFYTRELDVTADINQVVKYKIEFTQR